MKLRRSMTEQKFRDNFLRFRHEFFVERKFPILLEKLNKEFPRMTSAFILAYTPDQCEDFYSVLIDDYCVAILEISRVGSKGQFEVMTLADYKKDLKDLQSKIKLEVALDIFLNSSKV